MARILVVDDDELIARSLTRALKSAGHEVVVVCCARDADEVSEKFTLGVFDYRLPDGWGTDVARGLLDRSVVAAAVFFTSHELRTELGPVVQKPNWDALLETVESMLTTE